MEGNEELNSALVDPLADTVSRRLLKPVDKCGVVDGNFEDLSGGCCGLSGAAGRRNGLVVHCCE